MLKAALEQEKKNLPAYLALLVAGAVFFVVVLLAWRYLPSATTSFTY
jgi:hypothetical protein